MKVEPAHVLQSDASQWQRPEITQAPCCATKCGQQEVFDLLIRVGADVNATNGDGLAPFQSAVSKGQAEMLQKLILEESDAEGNSIPQQAISLNRPPLRRGDV
jgi:ankyrin repeat protein